MPPTTLSVIVVTYNRPGCLRKCLTALSSQCPPAEVIVVDSSTDESGVLVAAQFTAVHYIRNTPGPGMTRARNVGLIQANGEIVAFIDDDAYVHAGWGAALLAGYSAADVGGVGGRALNNQPGEESRGADRIGRMNANGAMTGNFAADPGRDIEVDHFIGCNMSFRRSILLDLGGLRADYPGTELREETDLCLRVRKMGYRLIFTPASRVDHEGAKQVRGVRFDTRYEYYAQHNHLMFLIRHRGVFSPVVWRYLAWNGWRSSIDFLRKIAGAHVRLGANWCGALVGMLTGVRKRAYERRGKPAQRVEEPRNRLKKNPAA